jgi:hypothetical protein
MINTYIEKAERDLEDAIEKKWSEWALHFNDDDYRIFLRTALLGLAEEVRNNMPQQFYNKDGLNSEYGMGYNAAILKVLSLLDTAISRHDKNGHAVDATGKLIFDPECRVCNASKSAITTNKESK